jgi:hypothetical protein
MRSPKRFALIILLSLMVFMPLLRAQEKTDLGDFYDNSVGPMGQDLKDFVDAGATTGTSTYGTILNSFGPGSCGDNWISTGSGFIIGMWIVPSVLVLMIVTIGVAIFYMAGQVIGNPQLIALSKDELFQVVMTALRLMFIIGSLMAGNVWYVLSASGSQDPIYGNPNNHDIMDSSMAFSRQMVSDMVSDYSMLLMYNMVIHTIYSSTMWFGVTWRAMYSFNLGPVLKPLIDLIGTSLQFLSVGLSEWLLHIVTLCLIKQWTWTLFIPVGLLLRTFPYTREAGEALLSLAFALALFYPFMFLFDYEVHKILSYNLIKPEKAVSGFIHNSGLLGVVGSVFIVMFLMGGVFIPYFLGGALTVAFELVRNSVYYIVMISILLPFLNIFVTLTSAREIAAFSKVDVNFMSFLKII